MTKYLSLADISGSDHFLELNPSLREKKPKEAKTEAQVQLEKAKRETFARQFEEIWMRCGGPPLNTEFKFFDGRKWSSDYLCVTHKGKFIIELDGGVWTGGRHTRPAGFIEDCMKLNKASMMGYFVIRIPTGYADDNYLSDIIKGITT